MALLFEFDHAFSQQHVILSLADKKQTCQKFLERDDVNSGVVFQASECRTNSFEGPKPSTLADTSLLSGESLTITRTEHFFK